MGRLALCGEQIMQSLLLCCIHLSNCLLATYMDGWMDGWMGITLTWCHVFMHCGVCGGLCSNLLLVQSEHEWMFSEVDILTHLMYPLVGPEDMDEDVSFHELEIHG
jgi:hypothetical protein